MVDKLKLPFGLLSDPEGEVIRRYDVWNEREEIAVPSIVVTDAGGIARYVYQGDDFSDRPNDDPVLAALAEAAGR